MNDNRVLHIRSISIPAGSSETVVYDYRVNYIYVINPTLTEISVCYNSYSADRSIHIGYAQHVRIPGLSSVVVITNHDTVDGVVTLIGCDSSDDVGI